MIKISSFDNYFIVLFFNVLDTYLLHFNIPVQKYRNGTMANKVVPANLVQFGDLCIVLEQIAKKTNKQEKEKCLDKFLKDFKLKAASVVEEKVL